MRIPLSLPERSISDAKLYMGNSNTDDAVESLIDSYGVLVADNRKLRARVQQLDFESTELDRLVSKLQALARQIDEL